MKTDDFVSMLATGVAPVDPDVSGKRFRLALSAGALSAVVAVLLAQRLSRPGMRLGAAAKAWTGPVIAMALLALLVWMDAPLSSGLA